MYNTKQMNLLFFEDFICHLLKFLRILRMQRGNVVQIGLMGSGRNTICKLGAFMREYQLFEIDITKGYKDETWKEDLKSICK